MKCYIVLSLVAIASARVNDILLTNDDGWAVAQIRAQRDALVETGFNVILSAPAENKSGTGSSTATPQPLTEPCEFNTCPTGSPAEGFDRRDPRLNYVNSFPVDAVRFGIQNLAPFTFGSKPELVVSGPNVGNNLGTGTLNSGTVGAACEAAKEGIPSIAFSAATNSQVSYTTLFLSPTSPDTLSSLLYAQMTANFTRTLLRGGGATRLGAVLPSGVLLNVNYAATTFSPSGAPNGQCATPSDFRWVFTRLLKNATTADVESCGRTVLPDESTVIDAGCFATVTVMNATTKSDVGADVQRVVLERLTPSGMLTCFT